MNTKNTDELRELAGIHYVIHLPEIAEADSRIPVALLVHGWGGDETVMRFFEQVVPKGVAIVRPRAIVPLDEGGYGWFDTRGLSWEEAQRARQNAIETFTRFLQALPKKHPLNPVKMCLIGFSQGGIMGNFIVLSQPGILLGLAPLGSKVATLPKAIPMVDSLQNFPVFIAHGIDDDVIPIADARAQRDLYQRLNANVTYGEYAVGHKMNTQAIKDLKAWVADLLG